jgi:hypothetical protein
LRVNWLFITDFMTSGQAAELANHLEVPHENDKAILEFIATESPNKLRQFIHCLNTNGQRKYFHTARIAIEIKLSENADLRADKLSKQTDRLIKFTLGLYLFTIALFGIGFIQILIMLMEYCSKNH